MVWNNQMKKAYLILVLHLPLLSNPNHQHPSWVNQTFIIHPNDLTNKLSRRFFMIALLNKPIEFLMRKLSDHNIDIPVNEISMYHLKHPLITTAIEDAIKTDSSVPIKKLWTQFLRFKDIESTLFTHELGIITYHGLLKVNQLTKAKQTNIPLKSTTDIINHPTHRLLDAVRYQYEQGHYEYPLSFNPEYSDNFTLDVFGMITSTFRFYLINRIHPCIHLIRSLPLLQCTKTPKQLVTKIIATPLNHPDIIQALSNIHTQSNHKSYIRLADRFTAMQYIQDIPFLKDFIKITCIVLMLHIIDTFYPLKAPFTLHAEFTQDLQSLQNNSIPENLDLIDSLKNQYLLYKHKLALK